MKAYEEVIIDVTINGDSKEVNAVFDGEKDFLVNLCPHAMTIVIGEQTVIVPPSGIITRCAMKTVRDGREFCGIPVSHTEYGEVENLPDQTRDVGFIVSGLIKARVPERDDVFAPAETIRNDAGQIAGATSLGV